MKQFVKMAAAAFVGVMVYEACYDTVQAVIRKHRHKKKHEEDDSCPSCYSPKKSGRGTIGFKMQGEE